MLVGLSPVRPGQIGWSHIESSRVELSFQVQSGEVEEGRLSTLCLWSGQVC